MNRYEFSHPEFRRPRWRRYLGHIDITCPADTDPHEHMPMEASYWKRRLGANVWVADPLVSESNYWYVDYWYDSGLEGVHESS